MCLFHDSAISWTSSYCLSHDVEEQTQSVNGYVHFQKVSSQKGLDSAFSRWRTLDRQVLMWTILKGGPWVRQTLLLRSTQAGPDGMVMLAAKAEEAECSGGSSSLAFTSSAESKVTFGICASVLHPAQSVWWVMQPPREFFGPPEREPTVRGPGFWPGDFFWALI